MLANFSPLRPHGRVGVLALAIFIAFFTYLRFHGQTEAQVAEHVTEHFAEPFPSHPQQTETLPTFSSNKADAIAASTPTDLLSSENLSIGQLAHGQVDGVIVIGRKSTENTSWVDERLPEWQHAIYTVDEPSGQFRVPMNKGKESMPYLTYLIDHYDALPETIVFLHSHEKGYPDGWHTDAPDNSNVESVKRLRREHVQQQGYVNLRCIFVPGCPDEIQPFRDPPDLSDDKKTERLMRHAWAEIFRNTDTPHVIAVPCCAQFAVSRKQILRKPKSYYVHIRQWIINTEGDDPGRILEYLWHIIFGMEPVQYV